ncbi:hypothetical protein, partial [Klebsiella pneumoniae]|uniref:hypothetical protein n=1 Tax=Klebsiella pneumoniae TaxID=573 RepID=UPI001D0DCA4E
MADPISIVMLWFLISLFIFYLAKDKQNKTKSVSYKHLTLPTERIVQVSVVRSSLPHNNTAIMQHFIADNIDKSI